MTKYPQLAAALLGLSAYVAITWVSYFHAQAQNADALAALIASSKVDFLNQTTDAMDRQTAQVSRSIKPGQTVTAKQIDDVVALRAQGFGRIK